jgi:hypothetical protein
LITIPTIDDKHGFEQIDLDLSSLFLLEYSIEKALVLLIIFWRDVILNKHPFPVLLLLKEDKNVHVFHSLRAFLHNFEHMLEVLLELLSHDELLAVERVFLQFVGRKLRVLFA